MQKIAKINGEVWVRTSEILQTLQDMSGMPAQDVLQELERQLLLDNSEAGGGGGAGTTVGVTIDLQKRKSVLYQVRKCCGRIIKIEDK